MVCGVVTSRTLTERAMARLGLLQDYNAVFSPGGQLAAYPLMAQWAGIGPAAAMETRLLIATSEEAVNAAFKAAGNADLQRAVLDIEVVDSPLSRHTP